MVGRQTSPAPVLERVFLFTVKNYSVFGTREEGSCFSWGKKKFVRWLREGGLIPDQDEHGDPIFLPEFSEAWAVEQGCFWLRCHTLIGGLRLYALLPFEIAREIGTMLGVPLEDPRGPSQRDQDADR